MSIRLQEHGYVTVFLLLFLPLDPDPKHWYEATFFSTLTLVLGRFFHGSGFSRSDLDFWPTRIRTQEKKSDPNPGGKNQIRNTGFSYSSKCLEYMFVLKIIMNVVQSIKTNYTFLVVEVKLIYSIGQFASSQWLLNKVKSESCKKWRLYPGFQTCIQVPKLLYVMAEKSKWSRRFSKK